MKAAKTIVALLCILVSTIVLQATPRCISDLKTYFYHIKCLAESTYFFSLLDEQNYCYTPCNCSNQNQCIQIDSTDFFHYKITSCIKKMRLTQSLKPIVLLLQEVKNHFYDQDVLFFRELFLLVFTIHKQIIVRGCEEKHYLLKKTTLDTIIMVSERINQLPIAEILNAIDMLITELPPLLEKYEFNSKLSWKNWLKKYWWVPPVFGGWFVLKVLLSLQRHQFYYSSYSPYSPKPQVQLSPLITSDPQLLEISREHE